MTPPHCLLLVYTGGCCMPGVAGKRKGLSSFSLVAKKGSWVSHGLFGARVHYIAYNACIFSQESVYLGLFWSVRPFRSTLAALLPTFSALTSSGDSQCGGWVCGGMREGYWSLVETDKDERREGGVVSLWLLIGSYVDVVGVMAFRHHRFGCLGWGLWRRPAGFGCCDACWF